MRRLRQLQAGACYHVTVRVNRKEFLLAPALAKDLFINTLVLCRQKYSFHLDNFVVMDNHVHLLITPGSDMQLPNIMKWLLAVYTACYNKANNTCGHIWGERYFSRIIRHMPDYISTNQYIDNNPVKERLTSRTKDWPWCACYHRSRGLYILASPLPAWLLLVLPAHAQLCLPLRDSGTSIHNQYGSHY